VRSSFFDSHRLKNRIKDSISNIALIQRCPILRTKKQSPFPIADELPEQSCNFGMNIDVSDCVSRFQVTRKCAAFGLLTNKNRREVIGKMLVDLKSKNLTDSHSCCPTKDEEHAFQFDGRNLYRQSIASLRRDHPGIWITFHWWQIVIIEVVILVVVILRIRKLREKKGRRASSHRCPVLARPDSSAIPYKLFLPFKPRFPAFPRSFLACISWLAIPIAKPAQMAGNRALFAMPELANWPQPNGRLAMGIAGDKNRAGKPAGVLIPTLPGTSLRCEPADLGTSLVGAAAGWARS